jgi:hypothetical protein
VLAASNRIKILTAQRKQKRQAQPPQVRVRSADDGAGLRMTDEQGRQIIGVRYSEHGREYSYVRRGAPVAVGALSR